LVKAATDRDQLYELLHPVDPLDVPAPGFPSHAALVAWAKTKDKQQIRDAALDILRNDEWPQQYAAMALLRELGQSVEGEGHGHDFRWIIENQSNPEIIVPRHLPIGNDSEDDTAAQLEAFLAGATPGRETPHAVGTWERQLRRLLARAILELDDASKIALTLHYFEGLTYEQIAGIMGSDMSVEAILRGAIQQIRDRLTGVERQGLRRYLDEALMSAPLSNATLAFAALIAA
jgi:hypothetical protein